MPPKPVRLVRYLRPPETAGAVAPEKRQISSSGEAEVTRPKAPTPPSATRDLARVRAPNGRGVYASDGDNYRNAFFARDSLEVSEDLLDRYPEIAHEVILELAQLQGTRYTPSGPRCNEEEPGRIHHEARERVTGGHVISLESQAILDALSKRWGGDAQRMLYYGSVDATPLYVRLVARYCARAGNQKLLDETVVNKDGDTVSVRSSVLAAAKWVTSKIDSSPIGLFEYHRRNPDGIEYQGWRDGKLAIMHPNGELAYPDLPIATIEAQGLAYDALKSAATLIGTAKPQGKAWLSQAKHFRESVLRAFWMPKENYFATAIDRDESGHPRQVESITAAAAELLDTEMFDSLDTTRYHRYVGGIVSRITSSEFITDAGVRTTSLRHRFAIDHYAYQGPFTVWHKQTYDIAKGLRRHGMPRLADQLENRIVNTCNAAGEHSEYVYVDAKGNVCLDPRNQRQMGKPEVIIATNIPDKGQAWTVSAALAIKEHRRRRLLSKPPAIDLWTRRQETLRLRAVPDIAMAKNRRTLARLYTTSHAFSVDQQRGVERESATVERNRVRWRHFGGCGQGLCLGA